jgi:signal transduction histidine kinase
MNKFKLIFPHLMIFISLTFLVSSNYFVKEFYLKEIKTYFIQEKEKSISESNERYKVQYNLRLRELNSLLQTQIATLELNNKKELKLKVERAYKICHKIYKKYRGKKNTKEIKKRIVELFSAINYENPKELFFITDYNANSILNDFRLLPKDIVRYRDSDSRAIVLEEIQKVRRHSEGYISSKRFSDKKEEITYVKALDMYDWYIGSRIVLKTAVNKIPKIEFTIIKENSINGRYNKFENIVKQKFIFLIDTFTLILSLLIIIFYLYRRK